MTVSRSSEDLEHTSLLSAQDGPAVEELDAGISDPRRSDRYRFRRRCGLSLFLLMAIVGAAYCMHSLQRPDFLEISPEGLVQKSTLGVNTFLVPYKVHPACPDDGGVCLCSRDGVFQKTVQCSSWRFQVGDAVLLGAPGMHFWFLKYIAGYFSSMVQHSPVIHAALVVSVPPPGIRQTPINVVLAESLEVGGVAKCTLLYLMDRYPWGSFFLRRVDPARFPKFHSPERLTAMQQFANANLGHPFDGEMINPLTNQQSTGGRYIPVPPTCADQKHALDLYKQGGLSRYMCSQFLTWTWAFAGGLNIDYGTATPGCDVPSWVLQNVQPFPGELLLDRYQVYEPGSWMKSCGNDKCFPALPTTVAHQPHVKPDGTSNAIDDNKPMEYPAA